MCMCNCDHATGSECGIYIEGREKNWGFFFMGSKSVSCGDYI